MILLAALALTALTARLGWWQLDRAAQKNQRQAELDERATLPPLDGARLGQAAATLQQQVYRPVVVTGRWVADRTVFLDNRQMHARVGFVVVTPLLLDDGSAVLVQRGWQPRDFVDRRRVKMPPAPAGDLRLRGLIAPPPARLYEFDAAASGPIRQNLDIAGFAAETRLRLLPLTILQVDEAEAAGGRVQDGLLRDWTRPATDVHKHYGYAVQWFSLSALTLGLYVWFQIIRPRRVRRLA